LWIDLLMLDADNYLDDFSKSKESITFVVIKKK